METARQHWAILRRLPDELANRVRDFMVIAEKEDGELLLPQYKEGVLFLTEDGELYWLGLMTFELSYWTKSKIALEPTPLNVPSLVSMAQGLDHILLLSENGKIYSVGKNNVGQLGLGTVGSTSHLPQLISTLHKFTSVRCGLWHNLALTEEGKVLAWGGNDCGQVGVTSSTAFLPSPRLILEIYRHRVVTVECGSVHSLALTYQGEVYAWGKLGDGSNNHTPTRIPTATPVKSIAAGKRHTLLLTQTGEVYACGENGYGQLGLPTDTKYSASFVKVAGLPPISQIASHFQTHLSIAMSAERKCFVWGCLYNNSGKPLSFITESTPRNLPSIYSTFDSVFSFCSHPRNTPCSVRIKGLQCQQRTGFNSQTDRMLTGLIPLEEQTNRMFDNPNSNQDVKFKLGDQTILAHKTVLQISSSHFYQLFSDFLSQANINPPSPQSSLNFHTTQISPFITIQIFDYNYSTFHAYLRFLYTGNFQVSPNQLSDLFELAWSCDETDLVHLCLARMRSTLSPENSCLLYQFTERYPLPEFQQEVLQFIADNRCQVFSSDAFKSMDEFLCKKLAISVSNLRR